MQLVVTMAFDNGAYGSAGTTSSRLPLLSENLLLRKLSSRTIVELVHFCRAERLATLDRFEPHIVELAEAEKKLLKGWVSAYVECLPRQGKAGWCVCQRCKLERLQSWHPFAASYAATLLC